MALNKIKNTRKDSGFTIVELLIVIVVIAILATISIVAYSGIQTRAKASKVTANAALTQKTAEAYYADKSVYPTTTAMFTTGNTYATLPATIALLTNATISTVPALSASNGENSLVYRYVGTAPNATGGCIYFWDFSSGTSGAVTTSPILMGNATTTNCSYTTGTSGNTLQS